MNVEMSWLWVLLLLVGAFIAVDYYYGHAKQFPTDQFESVCTGTNGDYTKSFISHYFARCKCVEGTTWYERIILSKPLEGGTIGWAGCD